MMSNHMALLLYGMDGCCRQLGEGEGSGNESCAPLGAGISFALTYHLHLLSQQHQEQQTLLPANLSCSTPLSCAGWVRSSLCSSHLRCCPCRTGAEHSPDAGDESLGSTSCFTKLAAGR